MATTSLAQSLNSTTDGTSYSASAFTPAAGDLLLAFVNASDTTAAGSFTTSAGLTFTLVTTAVYVSSGYKCYLFVADDFAANTSQTATFDCTGDAATGAIILVYAIAGMAKKGSAAILQTKIVSNAITTTPTITLDAAINTANAAGGFVSTQATSPAYSPPTGFSELFDAGHSTPTSGTEACYVNSGRTDTTLTWGTTGNRAIAIIAYELDTSAVSDNVSIAVASGTITATGLAPTVAVSDNVSIAVASGTITATGLAPTVAVSDNVSIAVASGTITATGLAPTVAVSDNVSIAVASGTITATGLAPTVAVGSPASITTREVTVGGINSATLVNETGTRQAFVGGVFINETVSTATNITATPANGTLTLSGLAPSLAATDNKDITTSAGALILSGLAPSVSVVEHITIATPASSLTFNGLAPSLLEAIIIGVDVGALTLTGASSTLDVDYTLAPSAGALVISGAAPTIQTTQAVSPDVGALTLTGLAPSVNISYTLAVGTASLEISGQTPDISFGTTLQTPNGSLAMAVAAPNVKLDMVVLPEAGNLAIDSASPFLGFSYVIPVNAGNVITAGLSPVTSTTEGFIIPVGAGSLVAASDSPTISFGYAFSPSVGSLALSGEIVTLRYDYVIGVDAGAITITGRVPVESSSGEALIEVPAGSLVFAAGSSSYDTTGTAWWNAEPRGLEWHSPVRATTINKPLQQLNTVWYSSKK